MDFIEVKPGYELGDKCIQSIEQRSQHHADEKIRLMMFKLLNRLEKWRQSDIVKALKYCKSQDTSIIKELSIYLESKGQRVSNSIDIDDKEIVNYKKEVILIFTEILRHPPDMVDSAYRICWLDIILRAVQLQPENLD